MKGYKLFFLGVAITLLVLSAFWVGNVYAAVSCFTDTSGYWAESYICWLKTKNITTGYPDGSYGPNSNITRGEMAVFLRRIANVPPDTGDVYISTGPVNWVVNANTPTGSIQPYAGFAWLEAPSIGTYRFSFSPSLPSSLYNTKMYVKGVKICYDASLSGAYITSIEVKHFTYGISGYSYVNTIYDPTDLTDTNCCTLNYSTPSGFGGSDQVTIDMLVTYTDATDYVKVGVTTVILSPSSEAAVLENPGSVSPFLIEPSSNDGSSGK